MAELELRGLRHHYRLLGEGPRTVVFLHGLVMDNLSSWYFTLANPAATVARVLLYDLRGHGKSERPPSGYSVAELVADLEALLDGLGLDGPVDLVGNSFGGLLAISAAVALPERVASVVSIDGNLLDEAWGPEITRSFALEGEERDAMILRYAHSWAGRHSERKRNRLAANARALVHDTTMVRDLASSPPLTDQQLAGIECPVLALYGAESELLDRARRLERTVPRCELELHPARTHLLLWEATEELKPRLLRWLAREEAER